jgi:hypothetical protein
MTTIHSISINTNPLLQAGRNVRATRTSKSRQYKACIVATATAKTIERVTAAWVEHESTVATLTPVLEGLLAAWGLTSHAEVEAIHQARTKPWFDLVFPAERAARQAKGQFANLNDADRAAVKARLVAQGHVDPYEQKEHAFLEMARKLKAAMHAIAHIKAQNLMVGQQLVLSWHKDISNAQKALGAHDAGHYRSHYYALEIRTDIEVTTK